MRIDSSGNVGIGTTTFPSADYKFVVRQGTNRNLAIASQSSELSIEAYNDAVSASVPLRIYGAPIALMNGNVGIGTTSPAQKLHVYGSGTAIAQVEGSGSYGILRLKNSTHSSDIGVDSGSLYLDSGGAYPISFYTGSTSTERMRLDASGNLGLGVTPSAWDTTTTSRGIQFGRSGAIFYSTNNATASYGNNYYQDAASSFKFLGNGYALRYVQGDFVGNHSWETSTASNSSGAGATVTFSTRMTLDTSGNLTTLGNVTAYSDARVKANVRVIDNALKRVRAMRGVTYTRTDMQDTTTRHAGVIAQEVERALPEVVGTGNDGMKHVAYGNMVGLLIEAIKELQDEVEYLRAMVDV
jgi:hypothetical protein